MSDILETQIAAQYAVVISWFTPEIKTKKSSQVYQINDFPLELAIL